jgi:hypothetical protein
LPKNSAKKIGVFYSKQCKIMQHFFAENCQKSQKIVIITSTPGANPTTSQFTTGVVVGRLERRFKLEESIFVSKAR